MGVLFHLRPLLSENGLLVDVQVLAAYPLQDAQGEPLPGSFADAEGLSIDNDANRIMGDTQLIVSFEGRPRLVRYTPDGRRLREEPLPLPLRDKRHFAHPNQSLEAVTLHPRWGLLIAPERPLRGMPAGEVPIYAQDSRHWLYPLHPAPGSALVAMESLADGSLLTLERAFVSLLRPFVIALRHTHLSPTSGKPLEVRDIAVFDTSQGWFMDNFEGLARHRDRRFFMVSDDNYQSLQRTLLIYFQFELPNS